jgi:hypothetical protein
MPISYFGEMHDVALALGSGDIGVSSANVPLPNAEAQ